jgi:hypothetical protein
MIPGISARPSASTVSAPSPTSAPITARDLQTRLYQFADDSMLGRQVGRVGNWKGTQYIASEVKRLGLIPAGDNGTYFQVLPWHTKRFTNHSRMTVDGNPLQWEKDFVAVPGARAPRPISAVPVIFGGTDGDTTKQISAAQAAGKFVVVLPGAPAAGAGRGGRGGFGAPAPSRFADAVAVAVINLDSLNDKQRAAINIPVAATATTAPGAGGRGGRGGNAAPVDSLTLEKQAAAQHTPQANLRITRAAASKLSG